MIFELLDVKKKRLGTYTGANLIDGVIRRELVDRVIRDSMDVEFTLDMLTPLKEATYVMVSGNEWFRVNPIFKISDITYGKTLDVSCTSNTLDEAGKVDLEWDGKGGFVSLLQGASKGIGFDIEIKVNMSNEVIDTRVKDYLEDKFTLSEGIDVLLQVVGGVAEFDTNIKDDYVAKTVLRVSDNLGREHKDALIYGINMTDIRVDERIEGIITAVEYTGHEEEGSDGSVKKLTLNTSGTSVPTRHTLPNSNRTANITRYVESDGRVRYLLEDVASTRTYGMYTDVEDRVASPIIEERSNKDVTKLEDLVELAIKELDGKSVPKTQYDIQATVRGLDVADNLGIKIPHLKIDRYMPVISMEYDMRGEYESRIKVGDYLPSEIEKKFEVIEDKVGKGNENDGGGGGGDKPVDKDRGKLISTNVVPQTIVYTMGEIPSNGRPLWIKPATTDMYINRFDYYLSFEYVLSGDYSGGQFELGMSSYSNMLQKKNHTNNGMLADFYFQKLAETSFSGKTGKVDIRLNDYYQFMNANEYSGVSTRRIALGGGEYEYVIRADNYIYPYVSVYDKTGSLYYLTYLGADVNTPTTQEGLDSLPGYIKNFTVTGHERLTKDIIKRENPRYDGVGGLIGNIESDIEMIGEGDEG